jgi:hypothetical protein
VNAKWLGNLLLKQRSWCIVSVLQTEPTNTLQDGKKVPIFCVVLPYTYDLIKNIMTTLDGTCSATWNTIFRFFVSICWWCFTLMQFWPQACVLTNRNAYTLHKGHSRQNILVFIISLKCVFQYYHCLHVLEGFVTPNLWLFVSWRHKMLALLLLIWLKVKMSYYENPVALHNEHKESPTLVLINMAT